MAEASRAGILRILTIFWHNSIEVLTGWDLMITSQWHCGMDRVVGLLWPRSLWV
jgi:hypothetical protein